MSMFLLILMSMVLLILTIRQFLYTRGNIHFIKTNYHLNKLINKILTNAIKKFKNTWLKDLCGIEVIDITRHMDFNFGNSIKYILRSGHKKEEGYTDKQKTIEDLKKAVWYLNDEINTLEKQ